MPCTLEQWEIDYEEKRANKAKHGLSMTDERVTEFVACEALKIVDGLMASNRLSAVSKRWWEEHKERDKRRAPEKKDKKKLKQLQAAEEKVAKLKKELKIGR